MHSPAADDNSLIGCTSDDLTDNWSLASAHFGACLGAFFYWTRCFENNVPFNNILLRCMWSICSGI